MVFGLYEIRTNDRRYFSENVFLACYVVRSSVWLVRHDDDYVSTCGFYSGWHLYYDAFCDGYLTSVFYSFLNYLIEFSMTAG